MKLCTCERCRSVPPDERDLVTDVGPKMTREQVKATIERFAKLLGNPSSYIECGPIFINEKRYRDAT